MNKAKVSLTMVIKSGDFKRTMDILDAIIEKVRYMKDVEEIIGFEFLGQGDK